MSGIISISPSNSLILLSKGISILNSPLENYFSTFYTALFLKLIIIFPLGIFYPSFNNFTVPLNFPINCVSVIILTP